MSNKPLVIYHKGCLDGIAAAAAFYDALGDHYEYFEGVYGEPIPDVKDRVVYMLDFSYKMPEMIEILKQASVVNVLDHHESAINELHKIPIEYGNLNMSHCTTTKSGCIIAWEYQFGVKPSQLYRHIEDRDLWKFEMAGTREICAALYSGQPTYKCLTDLTLSRLRLIGSALVKDHDANVERIVATCSRPFVLDGGVGLDEGRRLLVQMANANHMYSSDVGNLLAKQRIHGVGGTYYDTETHRNFSLRSTKDGLNVAKIAANYGGGGHEHAAGFRVPRDHPLAKI